MPDHFHIEAVGAVRRMLLKGLIDEGRAARALDSLLTLPVTVYSTCRSPTESDDVDSLGQRCTLRQTGVGQSGRGDSNSRLPAPEAG